MPSLAGLASDIQAGRGPVQCHDAVVFKREYDPALDVFDRGGLVLRRDGEIAGYVATELGTWWTPNRPLTIQQQVWLYITWADGEQDVYADEPPWNGIVPSIRAGEFVDEDGPREGHYTATWLSAAESAAKWAELELNPPDF